LKQKINGGECAVLPLLVACLIMPTTINYCHYYTASIIARINIPVSCVYL